MPIVHTAVDKIDLNLVPIVLALYDEKSVSRAAQKLGVTQPAVSKALRKLRATFHDPLFIPASGGITPTPRAQVLVRATRSALMQLQDALRTGESFDPQLDERPFTFAMSDVGELVFLPKLLEHLQRLVPHSMIKSVSMPPEQLVHALGSGAVDLAVGYFPDLAKTNFVQQRLFTHHFACVIRAGHPMRAKRLSRDNFLAAKHAVVRAPGRSQEIFERFLEKKRIVRTIVLQTPHFLILPSVIARSDLIATVPYVLAVHFSRLSSDLAVALLPFEVGGFDVKQHWHRRYHNDARNKWIRSKVAQLFTGDSDQWEDDFR